MCHREIREEDLGQRQDTGCPRGLDRLTKDGGPSAVAQTCAGGLGERFDEIIL